MSASKLNQTQTIATEFEKGNVKPNSHRERRYETSDLWRNPNFKDQQWAEEEEERHWYKAKIGFLRKKVK